MLFKALTVYRLAAGLSIFPANLQEQLAKRLFTPCTPLQTESVGWVSPYEDDRMVVSVDGQQLISLLVEKKKVPGALVKQHLAKRIEELEAAQGFAVGRKQKKELKEAIIDELLPTTPPKQVRMNLWLHEASGRIAVGTASAAAAELALKALAVALDEYPAIPLVTAKQTAVLMHDWLATGEATADFDLGAECEMRLGESGATVKYVKHNLDTADVKQHIAAGKDVVAMGLTWNDVLRLTLTSNTVALQLKKLALLDMEDAPADDAAAQLEAQLLLEAGNYVQLLDQLVQELGGLYVE